MKRGKMRTTNGASHRGHQRWEAPHGAPPKMGSSPRSQRREEGARWERAHGGPERERSGRVRGNLPSTQDTETEPSDLCPERAHRTHSLGRERAGKFRNAQERPPQQVWRFKIDILSLTYFQHQGTVAVGGDVRTLKWEPSHPAPTRALLDSVVYKFGCGSVV